MFDIGLFELLVVGGVGLVVIGPERLPGAIRTGALWFGRIKRSILETRKELEQHIGADEIRRELRNEEIMASLEKLREARALLEEDIRAQTSNGALTQDYSDDASLESDNHQSVSSDLNAEHAETDIVDTQTDNKILAADDSTEQLPRTDDTPSSNSSDSSSDSTEQPISKKEIGK